MKPLDYVILAVIAVWFVLAMRSIWKRRGSCCGCQGCSTEKARHSCGDKSDCGQSLCKEGKKSGCCAQCTACRTHMEKEKNCHCH